MLKKLQNSGIVWLWVAVLVLIIDRASKVWVLHHLSFYEPVKILPMFNLLLTYNTGAAWSFLDSAAGWQQIFLGGLALVVSVVIVIWLCTLSSRDRWLSIALCLVLGGALGNVCDRILYGHVIDFLSFYWHDWHFAVFNGADSAISVGAFMLCIHWLFVPERRMSG